MGTSAITAQTLPFEHVKTIAENTYQEMRPFEQDIRPNIEVIHRPEPTPLGVIPGRAGSCRLIINTNPDAWAEWGRFLKDNNRQHWDTIIKASVAHELGHCMPEHRHGWQHVQLSGQSLQGLAHGHDKPSSTETRILKQELFADTVAVLYAKEILSPEERDAAISAMLTARVAYGNHDPSHNTARELSVVIQADGTRQNDESFGQAAARLLRDIEIN